jgi:hypothetical protein
MFFVSDQQHHVVLEMDTLTRATRWRQLSSPWPAGSFLRPAGIVQAPDGRLIMADRGHHRLVVLSADGSEAEVLAPDRDPIGTLWEPTGVALGQGGELSSPRRLGRETQELRRREAGRKYRPGACCQLADRRRIRTADAKRGLAWTVIDALLSRCLPSRVRRESACATADIEASGKSSKRHRRSPPCSMRARTHGVILPGIAVPGATVPVSAIERATSRFQSKTLTHKSEMV